MSGLRPPRPARSARDLYGLLPPGGRIAPVLSAVGLVAVALVTLSLLGGRIPLVGGGGAGGGGPILTPAPSDVVIVDPRADVPGEIIYAKQGTIWIQSGTSVRQLTNGGSDSMPSWAPDGSYVYFIRTITERGLFPVPGTGTPTYYTMEYPLLMRVKPDGSGHPEQLATGKYTFSGGRYQWFFWMREPVVSPDGHTVALVSDGPDPTRSDVVLQFLDLRTGKMTRAQVPENAPLGHQDPAWRPDGRAVLYVFDARDGSRGTPSIWRYDIGTGRFGQLSGPGYLAPTWSPDGRYIAATKIESLGTDVVILDGTTGAEVMKVTKDGRSWSPIWSPAGDALAYLHVQGEIVDLKMARLEGAAPGWTVKETLDLTNVSGLDGQSRPGWFIPPDQLPSPTPAPTSTLPAYPPASAPPSTLP